MSRHTLLCCLATTALLAGCAPDRDGSQDSASGITTSAGGTESDSASSTTDDSTTNDTGEKFDIALSDMSGAGDCTGGGGTEGEGFSYIWIANSTEGTVSKISTKTGVEEGRYWTDPTMGQGSPSRTSVNLLGDVAVSNRNQPSTTKVAVREERCVDANQNGVIDTSTGPADVRPWGQDECVLWHVAFPDAGSGSSGPRPTQWEAGDKDQNGCLEDNPRLWVVYRNAATEAVFQRLDGATGTILDTVSMPWGDIGSGYGPYGGVVNAEGDLFVSGLGAGPLVHVDSETLVVTNHGNPGTSFYGIGIDVDGNPWMAGGSNISIFDDAVKQWVVVPVSNGSLRGIQIDRDGMAWAAGNAPCGLVQLDAKTRAVVNQQIDLPGCVTPVGVSIDEEGYVWSPDQAASVAYKVDPANYQVVLTVAGLVGPYTYSDMTGAGLGLVGLPPQG